MAANPSTPATAPGPGPAPSSQSLRQFRTATGLIARLVVTRGRIVGLLAFAVPILLVAVAMRTGAEIDADGFIEETILGLAVPVLSLTAASAALGDLVEDGTLVYLWLRPLPRWHLGAAAAAATLAVVAPPAMAIAIATALIGGEPGLMVPAAAATLGGVAAYGALFVALGLRANRALLWGLLYVMVWEGFLSRLSHTLSLYAVRRYMTGLFGELGGQATYGRVSVVTATLVLAGITAAGIALTTRLLSRRDTP